MSKARDIANILSANTAIATDAEVTTAVSAHATAANGHVGRGTTVSRPASPTIGDLYFDTTLNALIAYRTAGWEKVSQDPAPQIASISPTTAVLGNTITITGSGFKSGLSVQFIGTNAVSYNSPTATFVNGSTATATSPALPVAYEPYDVKVINNDNQFAVLENCLDSGGTPVWNTFSGSLGTVTEQTAVNLSVSATDPDGTSIIYSSYNLPVWLSLGSSTGALTGTAPDIEADTTYTFDITASDGVNSSSRSFSITSSYVPPVVSVQYLIIGGGGSGDKSGGGGAGGVLTGTSDFSLATPYTLKIGAGGSGGFNNSTKGTDSQFASLIAYAGGVGGATAQLKAGGSGAGAHNGGTPGVPVAGQGYAGATGPSYGSNGGGGGAGGAASTNNGGIGIYSSITGSNIIYAGGGGGGQGDQNGGGGPGGAGGGGHGGGWGYASWPGPTSGSQYGAGGGGQGYAQDGGFVGGNGYQGYVVLKYPDTKTISAPGCTVNTSTSGGFKISQITAGTGTVTFN
jgi:hypothetical protein